MCRKLLCALVAFSLAALTPMAALAQVSPQGLLSAEGARRAGLMRMWFTQLEMDRGQGRMQGVTQHVSSRDTHTVFEVVHLGRSYVFSERDRDAFGEPLGVERAKEAAEKKVKSLTAAIIPPAAAVAAAEGKAVPLPPPADAPTMSMHVVPEITLYATSERGMVHAIDGETGRTKWATAVGNPNYPTTNAGASDDVVAVINGSTVYVLQAADGVVAWEKRINGAPATAPAVSDDYIFIPALSGIVEAYSVDNPKRAAAKFLTMGHPTSEPVVLNRSVAWATDRRHIYVAGATDAKIRFRVETKDYVAAAPGYLPPDSIFTTSRDGYVYCVHESLGGIMWRFSTGEPITHSPVGVIDTVYAIADIGTMFAIKAEDGSEKWTSPGIRGFIAATGGRLYCSDISRNIVVIDATSGSRVASIKAPELEVRMINTETDRLIVGTPSGLLQCFREIDRKWPDVRLTMDEGLRKSNLPAKPKKPTTPAEEGTEEKPAVPAGEDPFGGKKEPDPFSKPGPEADPFSGK